MTCPPTTTASCADWHAAVVEHLLRLTGDAAAVAAVVDLLHTPTGPDLPRRLRTAIGWILADLPAGAIPAGSPLAALLCHTDVADGWQQHLPRIPNTLWGQLPTPTGCGPQLLGQLAGTDDVDIDIAVAMLDLLHPAG